MDAPNTSPTSDDAHQRRVIRYLSIMRQLGVLVAGVFLVGLLLGAILVSAGQGSWLLVAMPFATYLVYWLFDRLMRITLGSKYSPL